MKLINKIKYLLSKYFYKKGIITPYQHSTNCRNYHSTYAAGHNKASEERMKKLTKEDPPNT